jgi:hypothetical protein
MIIHLLVEKGALIITSMACSGTGFFNYHFMALFLCARGSRSVIGCHILYHTKSMLM